MKKVQVWFSISASLGEGGHRGERVGSEGWWLRAEKSFTTLCNVTYFITLHNVTVTHLITSHSIMPNQEMVMDFRKEHRRMYTPPKIFGTPVD